MKRCYYQILEVDRKATPTEIKQSYRKLALKYHPDKNPDQDTKHKFVQINEAYNVLSDVNERTWYDNNREKILFNKDQMSKEDLEQYSFGFNIWNYFTMNCFEGYADNPEGFFAVYRDVFEKIKAEEAKAYNLREDVQEEFRKYEGFGDSTTSQQKMIKFYEDWENFTTYKTFVWSEEWDTREAGNRWIRRQMQKENKKQRQGEKKNYIKTIKDLIAYVKKRDPRFRDYQMKLKEEQQKKMQERLEREKQKKIEKEQMKHVKQKLEQQRFKEIQEYFKKQNEDLGTDKNVGNGCYEEDIDKQFYCEICQKGFKSENQLRNHEKSKQHKQMVKNIEKQVLLKEEIRQKAEEDQEPQAPVQEEKKDSPTKKRNKKKKNQQAKKQQSQQEEEVKVKPQPKKEVRKEQTPPKPQPMEESQSDDDDDAFMSTLLNNRKKGPKDAPKEIPKQTQPKKEDLKKNNVKPKVESEDSEEQTGEQSQKVGKAKLKKQKKAEQQKAGKSIQLRCNVCQETFSSKSKLFDHINKLGHASAK